MLLSYVFTYVRMYQNMNLLIIIQDPVHTLISGSLAVFDTFFHVCRFGLSLVADVPLDVEVDAKTNAAVGIARAFSFIASDKDPRQAFDWFLQVC